MGTGVHKYKCRHKHTHTGTAEQLHSRWHNGHTEDSESFYNYYTQKYISGNMVKKKRGKCLQSTVLYTSLKPGKNHVKPNSTLNKLSPKTCDIPQRCTAQNNTKDDAQHLSCLHPCVPSIRPQTLDWRLVPATP